MSGISLEMVYQWVQVLSPLISIILTAALVFLYLQQKRILEEQTEIGKSDQRALLRIRTYDLFSWIDVFWNLERQDIPYDIPGLPDHYAQFVALISNAGKGYADDLRAELVIDTPSTIYSVTSVLAFRTNMDQAAFSGHGGVLSPGEGEVAMTSELVFDREDLEDLISESGFNVGSTVSPTELLWMLDEVGVSSVKTALFIHYRDGTGRRKPIQLLTSQNEIDGKMDIRSVLTKGGPTDGEVKSRYAQDHSGYNKSFSE